MAYFGHKKSDWKLFCERLPEWQEKYMERLIEGYIGYLQGDDPASTKFWEMEKRIRQDRRTPGVFLRLEKSNMDFDIIRLIRDGVIGFGDLKGFSHELINRIEELNDAH